MELMLTANNMTVAYAEALLAATPPPLLVGETKTTEDARRHRRSDGENGARNGKPASNN